MDAIHVTTRPLSGDEAEALLARHHVGRMAVSFHDRVTIALVNYKYETGWIYARMPESREKVTLAHHQWVAFQVDEIQGIYDWSTVNVHGSVQVFGDEDRSGDRSEYDSAVEVLRSVVPHVLTAGDPMPERVHVFRIHVDDIVGWNARSDAPAVLPAP